MNYCAIGKFTVFVLLPLALLILTYFLGNFWEDWLPRTKVNLGFSDEKSWYTERPFELAADFLIGRADWEVPTWIKWAVAILGIIPLLIATWISMIGTVIEFAIRLALKRWRKTATPAASV